MTKRGRKAFPLRWKDPYISRDHWTKSNGIYKVLFLTELYKKNNAESTDEIIVIVFEKMSNYFHLNAPLKFYWDILYT